MEGKALLKLVSTIFQDGPRSATTSILISQLFNVFKTQKKNITSIWNNVLLRSYDRVSDCSRQHDRWWIPNSVTTCWSELPTKIPVQLLKVHYEIPTWPENTQVPGIFSNSNIFVLFHCSLSECRLYQGRVNSAAAAGLFSLLKFVFGIKQPYLPKLFEII
jgi:hypothetical protein